MHILFLLFVSIDAPKGRLTLALAAQAELRNERPVTFDVLVLQVLQETTPLAHQLQEPPPRMEIVLVFAQMLGEVPDARREQRDLHLGRPRVAIVRRVLLDYSLFVLYYRQLPLLLFVLFCSDSINLSL